MTDNNSLKQYIDLVEENFSLINKGLSTHLIEIRKKALARLKKLRFPKEGSEGYEKISMNDFFSPDFGINLYGHDLIGKNIQRACGLENSNYIRIYSHNDVVTAILMPAGMSELPSGLKITSFSPEAANIDNGTLKWFDETVENGKPEEILNILTSFRGILIELEEDCMLNIPIQLINYSGADFPILSNRKILIKMGKNSSCEIISCDHSVAGAKGEKEILCNTLIDIRCEKGSMLKYTDIEESSNDNRRVTNTHIVQHQKSDVTVLTMTLINGKSRNNWLIDCVGDETQTMLGGLIIGKRLSLTDNFVKLNHEANHGRSNQIFKYALFDDSQGVFNGTITVSKDARFNEAFQTNRNILASINSGMFTKPQLLIYNDDVKCSHGATTGRLDERAVYYMQTRGVPRGEAETMLMQAFMNDLIDKVSMPALKDRLQHLVEKSLKGEDVLCSACKLYSDDKRR